MADKKDNNAAKRSLSELAHISTLSDDELAEQANEAVDAGETEGYSSVNDYMPAGNSAEASQSKAVKRLEHTEPKFVVESKPDTECMYEFMMYHSYANVMGMVSVLIGLGALGYVIYLIATGGSMLTIIMFSAVIVLFAMNNPLTLKKKAKQYSEDMCDPEKMITFTFSDAGLDLAMGDKYTSYEWSHLYKVKEGKLGFFVYLERNHAFVISKEDLGTEVQGFKSLLKSNVKKRLKLLEEA